MLGVRPVAGRNGEDRLAAIPVDRPGAGYKRRPRPPALARAMRARTPRHTPPRPRPAPPAPPSGARGGRGEPRRVRGHVRTLRDARAWASAYGSRRGDLDKT